MEVDRIYQLIKAKDWRALGMIIEGAPDEAINYHAGEDEVS